jgi:hypothetical protein
MESTFPTFYEDQPQREDDAVIWRRATAAQNAQKFILLCEGCWQGRYPSANEADLALLSMLGFYSRNDDQVMRMYAQTVLGQRAKQVAQDYRTAYLTLRTIRQGQAKQDAALRAVAAPVVAAMEAELAAQRAKAEEVQRQKEHIAQLSASLIVPK